MVKSGKRSRLPAFVAELHRRRVIKVAIAYALVGWATVEVAATVFPLLELPSSAATLVLLLVLLGFPLTVVMAWMFDVTPAGLRRTLSPQAETGVAQLPPIRYADSDGVSIAYYTLGDGPVDLVLVQGWVSHLEYAWETPTWVEFMGGLASFSRVITFDKRGTGLSDRTTELPTLEQRMDDVRAVMDAVGSERAVVFGYSEGGPMAMLFAATYPERTLGLALYGTYAKRVWSPDYPWAPTPEERQKFYDSLQNNWAEADNDIEWLAPSMIGNQEFMAWWSAYQRRSVSPGAALALARMNTQIDARHVLPSIRVPALVMHRRHDRDANVEEGRFIAARIPNARFLELAGVDHAPFVNSEDIVRELRRFVSTLPPVEADSVLATILHVEPISTDAFREAVRKNVARFRGSELQTEVGFQAAFEGPARAVRCAAAIRDHALHTQTDVRIGLHAGECQRTSNGFRGLPLRIARAVAQHGDSGQVVVTSTIKDVVAGSGLTFEEHGSVSIVGVPGDWRSFIART